MKVCILFFYLIISLFTSNAGAQEFYKKERIIIAKGERADIQIGKDWYNSRWRISPEVPHDTLHLKIYDKSDDFTFRTDTESISFQIKPGKTKSFYVKMGDAAPAHTVIAVTAFKWTKADYGKKRKRADLQLFYESPDNAYFDSLRQMYPIDQIIKDYNTDTQKVLSILNWVHHQWKHDGNSSPKKNDAISILNEVRKGGRFPCFAYAIVLRDQLTAQGYKARIIYLKTKDAATRKDSPGHVATEVYLNDIKKWAFIDGQFNIMPTLNDEPLNAAEFQKALTKDHDEVVMTSKDKVSKRDYIEFVYDYLYYFDTPLDNRLISEDKKFKLDGKRSLMLVPEGAPNLTKIDFWNSDVDYCIYTNSIKDFYALPD